MLAKDYARCRGNEQAICKDCLRRLAINTDDGVRSYVVATAKNNECSLKIPVNRECK